MLKNKNFTPVMLKAFTISELLIALGVIAVLTTVLMPIVHSLIPDQNILMAKRAFYTTETVINGLINDEGCYPSIRAKEGFENDSGYTKCSNWGKDSEENAAKKFSTLFTNKLDIKGTITYKENGMTFETKDGLFWDFQSINFEGENAYTVLTIDVNGAVKGPNCGQSSESSPSNCEGRTKGFDKFTMHIHRSGKIDLMDCWAIRSVRTDKKLIGKFEEGQECTSPPTSPLACITKPTVATDACCASARWRDVAPCNTDPCANQPESHESACCKLDKWANLPPCYVAPPLNNDECSTEPTDPNDECCDEPRYKGRGMCDPCVANPNDLNCCLSKTASINKGDACCNYSEIKDIVRACRKDIDIAFYNLKNISALACDETSNSEYCEGLDCNNVSIMAAARKFCKDKGMTIINNQSNIIKQYKEDIDKKIPSESGLLVTDASSGCISGAERCMAYSFDNTGIRSNAGYNISALLDGTTFEEGNSWFACYKYKN